MANRPPPYDCERCNEFLTRIEDAVVALSALFEKVASSPAGTYPTDLLEGLAGSLCDLRGSRRKAGPYHNGEHWTEDGRTWPAYQGEEAK